MRSLPIRFATTLCTLFALGLTPATALASSDGRADGATDCAPCHGGSATASVPVSITGSSTLMPGETGTYTLSIGVGGQGGAFDIAATGGVLGVTEANTKILSGDVVHTDSFSPQPNGNIGDWSYSFTVTAPGTLGSTITIAAVGMQFDDDGDNGAGDVWNLAAPFDITVVPEPGTGLLVAGGLIAMAIRRRGARA